ncbi:MAG: lipopolysaccharide heptosyltransferase II [Candidatus Omnitrophota bacterium]|nr:lipopolysaccharide heptosyltransferase II [Candidatus Omnitrophota bacterium]
MIDKSKIKKILIIRTDRIGDVVLSTPVIKAVREAFPQAYIAVMVRPYTKDIVIGNPYLDEVIVYDKYGVHKSWRGTLKFALSLRRKKFDLALILHPTNRVHIVSFLAGIPSRIGYRKKCGFLLTGSIEDKKHLGKKHELEYNFDLTELIGIKKIDRTLFMPVAEKDKQFAGKVLKKNGFKNGDNLITIHPGSSCSSKRWLPQNFARLSDRLSMLDNIKVIMIGGPADKNIARQVSGYVKLPIVNLCGQLNLKELAGVIQASRLFITNDNGPMHIASAVGTPVIAIFGRNQAGLSPVRWGPTGEKDVVLHKDVGCKQCLAHNCRKGFKCLKAITVEEVAEEVNKLLRRHCPA